MAAEEILFGSYDAEGSASDRASIVKEGASVQDSVNAARALLQRDEVLLVGKKIEQFALENDSGYIVEANLFATDNY